MSKKVLLACLMVIISANIQSASAFNTFEAGISIDNNQTLEKKAPKIPTVENGFYDLYYSINFKPLDMLSSEEAIIRKAKSSILINPLNALINAPSEYTINTSTGKAKEMAISANDSLMLQLQKHPDNEELLLAYAHRLKTSKDYKKALTIVDAILDRNPDFALAHFLKGDILRYQNRLKKSVDEYLWAVELNPYLSDAYYNIAKILEILNDKKLAIDYYKMAYKVNPNDGEVKNIILQYKEL